MQFPPRTTSLSLTVVGLWLVLGHSLKAPDVVGRWELAAVTDRRGQVWPPAAARLTLLISDDTSQILSGVARMWSDPTVPPQERPCGVLTGIRRDKTHVTWTLFAAGESVPAMIMESEIGHDSMFVQSRDGDGTPTLPGGLSFLFVRASKDARLGCLTRA